MLVRVARDDIRLGMFIQSIEGSWLEHPFWRTRFQLSDPTDVLALRNSNIPGVIIDTARSAAEPRPGEKEEEGEERPPAPQPPFRRPAAGGPARGSAPAIQASAPPANQPCSSAEEFGRAERIVERTQRAVARLMSQARFGRAIDVAAVLPLVEEIAGSIGRNPSILISIARMRATDEHSYMHCVSVCALMVNLARSMAMEEARVRDLGMGGLLHDIGKMAVPASLLNKPGALNARELAIVRTHVERGVEALKGTEGISGEVLEIVAQHHEKLDGSGYPHGLKGEEIGLAARMCAVCDVYDAITSDRPYKDAARPSETLSDMFRWKGHLDEAVLTAFIKSVGIYPVGSLVKLHSGHLAMVLDQNASDLTRPVVRAFYAIAERRRIRSRDIDLLRMPGADHIVSREKPEKWGFMGWDAHWTQLLREQAKAA
jgi:putative nucleotidyltransferase with HDIG domain